MKKERIFFARGSKASLVLLDKEQDLDLILKWRNNPEVSQYLSVVSPLSREKEIEWLDSQLAKMDKQEHFLFGIWDNKQDRLIGNMAIHDIDHINRVATTGAMIGEKDCWGKGFGTNAKMLLLDFAFNQLNLRKIYSKVLEFNERSANYSKKCHYNEEARIPNHFYRNGKYHDEIILAVYQDMWQMFWDEEKERYLPETKS
ncbi:MAG: GNAT family N-acetyltransferase [Candidatus Nomurabacteria bacterium]|nr:GNAT family N-acetyltransferase [Candidatus Nomurabacteria bacterium]